MLRRKSLWAAIGSIALVGLAIAGTLEAPTPWPEYEENGVSAEEMLDEIIILATQASETGVVALAEDCKANNHTNPPANPQHYDYVELAHAAAERSDWLRVANELDHGG